MNIKATLARLGSTMADCRAARDLLLLPGLNRNVIDPEQSCRIDASLAKSDTIKSDTANSDSTKSDTINIVVGYSGSQNSQVALDLTLLIAYQTRLATRKQVIVQTVYVLEGIYHTQKHVLSAPVSNSNIATPRRGWESGAATATLAERRSRRHTVNCVDARAAQLQCFEEADQVLWKARTFATEWRGSLNTHLRFGSAAAELSNVAQQEQADLLIVGCCSSEHPLIEQLKTSTCCPVIGIPASLEFNPDLN